jgi:hypothetical protein
MFTILMPFVRQGGIFRPNREKPSVANSRDLQARATCAGDAGLDDDAI